MVSRRALIIAPLYDGKWLPPLPGSGNFINAIVPILRDRGGYETRVLHTLVTQPTFREAVGEFFDTDGELLFYYYGHGCLRPPGVGVFATSDAGERNEGVGMNEISSWAECSKAREVVAILDCCHSGAAVSVTEEVLSREAEHGFAKRPGRAILAACSAHQQGWEAPNDEQKQLGVFSTHIIEGLEGKARLRGSANVRASVLGAHITGTFRSWRQSPISLNCETGDRHCIITFGFDDEGSSPQIQSKCSSKAALYIGVPFKPSTTFVGRSAEIDFLRSMLLDGTKPIAVSASIEGLGGIGKTELVLQLLNDPRIASAFATIVWLDGAGPLLPQWEAIATTLKLTRWEEIVKKLRRTSTPDTANPLLAGTITQLRKRGNALIILDNASQWEPIKDQIPDDFPLLVTTRTRDFGGSSFHHSELGILSKDAAREFFAQLVPGIETNPALTRLIDILEGHALAIELAAHYIRDFCSPEEYVGKLKNLQYEIAKCVAGKTHYKQTVEACLQITWDNLKTDSARLLWRRAALFAPTSAHRDLLRTSFICGSNDNETRHLVQEMVLEKHDALRYIRGGQKHWQLVDQDDYFDPTTFIVGKPEDFDAAYAELRQCHVLARVDGFNGELSVVREFETIERLI